MKQFNYRSPTSETISKRIHNSNVLSGTVMDHKEC